MISSVPGPDKSYGYRVEPVRFDSAGILLAGLLFLPEGRVAAPGLVALGPFGFYARLLGPMERVLILGLGLAGQLGAAGLVIAAKGLIRFPELQSKRSDSVAVDGAGIDQVTEYFLVGSFVSWLLALGSLVLAR